MEFQLEAWHWWVLTLGFVVMAAMLQKMIYIWLTIATVIVGTFAWVDPQTPTKILLMLFGLITIGGNILSSYFLGRKQFFGHKQDDEQGGNQQDNTETDTPEFANQEQAEQQQSELVGRVFTLEEPIVNGSGTLNFDNQVWRIRGKDVEAGSEIRILSIDGIDSSLLQVSPVKSSTKN